MVPSDNICRSGKFAPSFVATDSCEKSEIVTDWNYFGPPMPGSRGAVKISPYWPPDISWNFSTLRGELTNAFFIPYVASDNWNSGACNDTFKLRDVAARAPLGGIPSKLTCICEGEYCLLGAFSQVCENLGIRRIPDGTKAINVDPDDLRWVFILPKVTNPYHQGALTEALQGNAISNIRSWYDNIQDVSAVENTVRNEWRVNDLNHLANAISVPGSLLMEILVGRCGKYN